MKLIKLDKANFYPLVNRMKLSPLVEIVCSPVKKEGNSQLYYSAIRSIALYRCHVSTKYLKEVNLSSNVASCCKKIHTSVEQFFDKSGFQ